MLGGTSALETLSWSFFPMLSLGSTSWREKWPVGTPGGRVSGSSPRRRRRASSRRTSTNRTTIWTWSLRCLSQTGRSWRSARSLMDSWCGSARWDIGNCSNYISCTLEINKTHRLSLHHLCVVVLHAHCLGLAGGRRESHTYQPVWWHRLQQPGRNWWRGRWWRSREGQGSCRVQCILRYIFTLRSLLMSTWHSWSSHMYMMYHVVMCNSCGSIRDVPGTALPPVLSEDHWKVPLPSYRIREEYNSSAYCQMEASNP